MSPLSALSACKERSLGRSELSMQELHLVVRGAASSESSCNVCMRGLSVLHSQSHLDERNSYLVLISFDRAVSRLL